MKTKPLPSLDKILLSFRYDLNTGKLFFLDSATMTDGRKSKSAGREAGTVKPNGYIYVHALGRMLMAHRIAWAIHHGIDPYPLEIDHINGIRSDNRICNLRTATYRQNAKNKKLYRNSRSRLPGVRWQEKTQKWQVRITFSETSQAIGSYKSKIYAGVVYARAAKLHYGKFRRRH